MSEDAVRCAIERLRELVGRTTLRHDDPITVVIDSLLNYLDANVSDIAECLSEK